MLIPCVRQSSLQSPVFESGSGQAALVYIQAFTDHICSQNQCPFAKSYEGRKGYFIFRCFSSSKLLQQPTYSSGG